MEFPGLVTADSRETGLSEADHENDAAPSLRMIRIHKGSIGHMFRTGEKYADVGQDRCFFSNSYLYMYIESNDLIYEIKEGHREEETKGFILGYGLGMYFYRYGETAVHCSCVEKSGSAFMISGVSGAGKSTVTGYLLEEGCTLMADDVAVIREEKGILMACPAFPYRKLCSDAAKAQNYDISQLDIIDEDRGKYMVPYCGTFSTEPVPVKMLIVLEKYRTAEENAAVKCMEITGADRLLPCLDNLFIAPVLGQHKKDIFTVMQALRLAGGIRIYKILRPEGRDTAAEVLENVKECMEKIQ